MLLSSDQLPEEAKRALQTDLNAHNVIKESDEWYYADTSLVTNSHLKKLWEGGPQHLKAYYQNGSKDSASFLFGRAFHCLVLEPMEFNKRYFTIDDTDICKKIGGARPRTTNKYKEWLEEETAGDANKGKAMISLDDHTILHEMQDKLMSINQVQQILADTQREVIYKGNISGVPVKCKMDAVKPNILGVDLKTMSDPASPYNMVQAVRNYKYDQQTSFYKDISGVPEFCIIGIEKTFPYTVGIYYIGEVTYEKGQNMYKGALEEYKRHFVGKAIEGIDSHYYQGLL